MVEEQVNEFDAAEDLTAETALEVRAPNKVQRA